MNLSLLLDMVTDAAPDRIAVGSRTGGLTYAEVRRDARRVAAALAERGNPRVAQLGANGDHIPALLFGCAIAGVPYASLNFRLADDRLQALLTRIAPAVVEIDDAARPRVHSVQGVVTVEPGSLAADGTERHTDIDDPAGDGVAVTLFTSGTSGDPKEVLLRHRNLFSYVIGTADFLAAGEDEAALVSVPAYHVAGLAAVLTNIYLGRRLVYLPQFDADAWVATVDEQRVTHAMIVPTMLERILDAAARTGMSLSSLQLLSYGGGRMPQPVIARAMAALPAVDFVNAYGLTETSSTIALLGPADHRVAAVSPDPAVRARLGSVGRPVPGVELEVRDVDGHAVLPGVTGDVVVRGEQVAGEYRSGDARDPDGWFRTNDTGHLDAGGYLFVEGRADDVIVRGGENMSPGEIEDVLREHPAVEDVAVLGIPDQEWGETPAAAVVLRPGATVGESELQAWVRSRLRSSRTPTVVVERVSLPYSATGKLLRRELRAELTGLADGQWAVQPPSTTTV